MGERVVFQIPDDAKKTLCVGCGRNIYFVTVPSSGKKIPVDSEGSTIGQLHFISCPARRYFRKGASVRGREFRRAR